MLLVLAEPRLSSVEWLRAHVVARVTNAITRKTLTAASPAADFARECLPGDLRELRGSFSAFVMLTTHVKGATVNSTAQLRPSPNFGSQGGPEPADPGRGQWSTRCGSMFTKEAGRPCDPIHDRGPGSGRRDGGGVGAGVPQLAARPGDEDGGELRRGCRTVRAIAGRAMVNCARPYFAVRSTRRLLGLSAGLAARVGGLLTSMFAETRVSSMSRS